jgi:hypothetical protein
MELLVINSLSMVAQAAQQDPADHPVVPAVVAQLHSWQSMASLR